MKCHRIALSALALLFFTATVAPAQQNPEKGESEGSKILKRLDDLEKGLSDSFKYLGQDIRDLKQDVTRLKVDALKAQITAEKVARLENQLKQLQADVEDLRKQSPARPSFSIDPNKQTVADLEVIRSRLLADIERMERLMRDQQPRVAFSAPLPAPARLVLVNSYPETLTFVVNGVSYPVEPGGTRQIDNYPPGTITYYVVSQIWGARGVSSKTLAPGEVYTISAR